MINKFSLQGIFFRFKFQIATTFFLLILENSLMLLAPLVLGIAIDGLLKKDISGAIYLGVIIFLEIIVGMIRRLYDTRVYSKIYATMATETVEAQHNNNESKSTIVARANLMQELIQFFEMELTEGLSFLIQVIGAILLLLIYNWKLCLASLIALLIIAIIYAFSEKYIFRYNRKLNDELEKQVDIIEKKDIPKISGHFNSLAKWWIKLSDLESINFSLVGLVILALILFSLFVSVMEPGATSGSIFAILAYILEFTEGVLVLPLIFQQFIRLQEITQRLNIKTEKTATA